jgi:hypothetical protein
MFSHLKKQLYPCLPAFIRGYTYYEDPDTAQIQNMSYLALSLPGKSIQTITIIRD